MLKNSTLRKAIKEFVEVYSKELNLQPSTVKNKRNAMKRFLAFLGNRAYTLDVIREYLAFYDTKNPTIGSKIAEIKLQKALSSYLCKKKYMSDNLAQDIPFPKIHRVPLDLLSPEIIEKVIIAGTTLGKGDRSRSIHAKEEAALALRFILRTGLRISEALKLSGSDFNLDDEPPSFTVQSKGGDIEQMPFPRDMVEIMKARTMRARVFETTEETTNDILQRGAKKLGINKKLTNHTLRHIFATSNLKNGVPLQVVSRLLRHDSVAVTDEVYSHYVLKDLALALNNQPIVKQGLTSDELLDAVERSIKHTGVLHDKRFNIHISKDPRGMTIKILRNKN